MLTLRPYQEKLVHSVLEARQRGRQRVMAAAPTGTGKTVSFVALHNRWPVSGRTLVLAHREELLAQAAASFIRADPGCWVETEQADRRAGSMAHVIVASVQTLGRPNSRRLEWLAPRLVICDEAHHAVASSYLNVFKRFGCFEPDGPFLVGVTATPKRLDRLNLHSVFEEQVFSYTIRDAIEDGWLTDIVGYRVRTRTNLRGVKTTAGDYNRGELEKAVDNEERTALAIRHWQEVASDRPTIVFCAGVAHAEHTAAAFQAEGSRGHGIAAAHVHGGMAGDERRELIARFKSGRLQVLCNVDILTEGFDCLDATTEILTPSGWQTREQISEGEPMYAFNRETGKFQVVPVERLLERSVRPGERMLRMESQHLNVRTTEGHQFHIRYRDPASGGRPSRRYLTKTGAEMAARRSAFILPLAGELDGLPGVGLSDDELRLIAWLMTDGWIHRSKFQISQSVVKHHQHIRDLLKRLRLDFTERLRSNAGSSFPGEACYEFTVPKGTHSGKLARTGWNYLAPYLGKVPVPALFAMTREQFRVFWEELLLGNGARQEGQSGWLWCPTEAQADALVHLAVTRGFAVSSAPEETEAGKIVYRVSARERDTIQVDPRDPRASRIYLEEPAADERVWCVTNRLGTLVARRGGKVAILGNCPALSCVVMLRPTQSWSFYVQAIGRGLRLADGKSNCIVIDVVDNCDRHSLATVPAILDLPASLDLEGNSLAAAARKLDELGARAAALSRYEPEKFADIETMLQQVDLLSQVETPREVREAGCRLAWLAMPDGSYRVSCGMDRATGARREVSLTRDLLGAWTLSMTLGGATALRGGLPPETEPASALQRSDRAVLRHWPEVVHVAAQDARWRAAPPTDAQLRALRKFKVPGELLAQLDRGTASALLDQCIARLRGERRQPAA